MKKEDKKGIVILGTLAVLGIGAAVAAPTVLGASENSSSSNGGFGGGGTLDGFSDSGAQAGEDLLSFEDFLNLIPQPAAEEPSLLDTPPNYPTVPEPATSTAPTAASGFWDSFFNSLNSPEGGERAADALKTTAKASPFLAAAVSPLPLPVRIAAGGAAFTSLGLGAKSIDAARNFVKTKTAGTAQQTPATKTVTKTATTRSGGGTGKARVVDTRTEQGQRDMAGASYVRLNTFGNTGRSTGKVTIW
jgi:hypothetical protein